MLYLFIVTPRYCGDTCLYLASFTFYFLHWIMVYWIQLSRSLPLTFYNLHVTSKWNIMIISIDFCLSCAHSFYNNSFTIFCLFCRAMDFLVELFRNLLEHADWSMSQACTDSYGKTLKKWHGWLASSTFTVSLEAFFIFHFHIIVCSYLPSMNNSLVGCYFLIVLV